MSWDQADFLARLAAAVERFDRGEASRLTDELIAALDQGATLEPRAARTILQSLRRKCFFDLVERAAEALRQAGQDEAQIRRQYAQALIDQGRAPAAIDALEALAARTAPTAGAAGDPAENAEARGLLGRVYKQLYVNAVNADPAAAAQRLARLNLARAVEAYYGVYRSDPTRYLWHGINTVALVCRAQRDRVELAAAPDPAALAREILAAIETQGPRGSLPVWDLATAAEACVALGRATDALLWIGEYVQRPEAQADAFELASTLRQLTEVWQLTIAEPPGSLLLPLLQSTLLRRKAGSIELAAGELGETIHRSQQLADRRQLERILGTEGVVTFGWYQTGLERCRTVAQVQTLLGEGIGTGFLVRGADFSPGLAGSLLLLTNAHVVSADPRVQAAEHALDPSEAQVMFEALAVTRREGAAAAPAADRRSFRVARQVWSSPPDQLDATLLTLDPSPPAADCFPLAPRLPVADGKQKVYVIGHPGGRSLALSLHDNVLLGHDGTRLLHYRAPTEGGSSGSPVFNQLWYLIGLHHAGGAEMQRLDGKPGTYAANEGIWIHKIIEETQAAGLRA